MPNSTAPHSQSRPRRSLNRPLPGSPRRWRPFTEDEVGWWPITFSDLVLLLFCFFVLWHVSDKQRAVAAARVVQPIPTRSGATAALTDVPLSPAPEPAAETVLPADRKGALQTRTNPTDTALLTIRDPRSAIHNPPAPALLTEQPEPALLPSVPVPRPDTGSPAADFDWQNMQAEIDRYVREHDLNRVVGVISTEHGLVISLNDTITFPSGQATLNPTVTPVLARVAALAAERPELGMEISGHTDDRPIATVEFPSNWELSAARASRVARALLEQAQIDPARISTRGYAHYRPLYPNDSAAHRAANRRVEIRFFRQVG